MLNASHQTVKVPDCEAIEKTGRCGVVDGVETCAPASDTLANVCCVFAGDIVGDDRSDYGGVGESNEPVHVLVAHAIEQTKKRLGAEEGVLNHLLRRTRFPMRNEIAVLKVTAGKHLR